LTNRGKVTSKEEAMRVVVSLFILASTFVSHFSAPIAAQDIVPVGIVSAAEDEVYRTYDSTSLFGAETEWGGAYSLEFIGDRFLNQEEAAQSFQFMVGFLPDSLPSVIIATAEQNMPGNPVRPSDPAILPAPEIGDEAFAISMAVEVGSFDDEYFGLLLVRSGDSSVMATAASYDEGADLIALLANIVAPTLVRWGIQDPVAVDEAGVRSGGIWNLIPTPDEVPAGFELNPAYEEGPGPVQQSPTSAPTPTPTDSTPLNPSPATTRGVGRGGESDSRIAEPFDIRFRIILAGSAYKPGPQNKCEGDGGYSFLREGGQLSITTGDGAELLTLHTVLEPGYLSYDRLLSENVCVFDLDLFGVPPRADYRLSGDSTTLATFGYQDVADAGLFEIVVLD
jgi:hypothetical protein